MRIVKTRYKVLFLLACVAIVSAAVLLLEGVQLDDLSDWINVLGIAAMTVVAVRIFRVPEEDVAAPRPLWRLTGRPTAGFLLGGLNVLGAASSLWSLIYTSTIATPSPLVDSLSAGGSTAVQIVSIVIDAALGALYLRSSIRLARRLPAAGGVQT